MAVILVPIAGAALATAFLTRPVDWCWQAASERRVIGIMASFDLLAGAAIGLPTSVMSPNYLRRLL